MRDLGEGQEAVDDERLQLGAVGDGDVEQVVLGAADVVDGERLGEREGLADEVGRGVPGVRADLDGQEGLLAAAEEAGAHVRPGRHDGAVAAHPADAFEAGAGGDADPGRNVLVRDRRINLQNL